MVRRFDYHLINKELIFIDDYAHHPEELRALITNVRNLHFDEVHQFSTSLIFKNPRFEENSLVYLC